MPNIDIREVNETMLDGMSNFIKADQWNEMLIARCNPEIKDESKILSPDFVVKYKNLLNFSAFTLYLSMAYDVKQIQPDFIRRFWRYVYFTLGENDSMLQSENLAGKENTLGKWAKENLELINIADILTGVRAPISLDELDKNPFRYNAALWNASMNTLEKVPTDFIDKYIHMVSFSHLFTNRKMSDADKEILVQKYGEAATSNETKYFFFPDGTTLEGKDWDSANPGRGYLSSLERFSIHDEEVKPAILKLKERFPRAFDDCMNPENAAVMVAK